MRQKATPEQELGQGVLSWMGLLCSILLLTVTLVVLAGWVGGDERVWSKWLSWVPAAFLLPISLIGLMTCWWVHGRAASRVRAAHGLLSVFLLSWILGSDLGLFRAKSVASTDAVLVHWNASWPNRKVELPLAYEVLRDLDADLVVITESGQFGWGTVGSDLKDEWPHDARASGALLLSREPILEVRPILYSKGVSLVWARLELSGVERSIWIIDLPSDPGRSKGLIFEKLLQAARDEGLEMPDIVVGDFNVTRRSRALQSAFPEMRNAFDESGVGWSGSWPREWPFWQLDQLLLGPSMQSRRYEIIDPGVGRHRMQRAVLRSRASGPAEE